MKTLLLYFNSYRDNNVFLLSFRVDFFHGYKNTNKGILFIENALIYLPRVVKQIDSFRY
jgi:hypothetical protein